MVVVLFCGSRQLDKEQSDSAFEIVRQELEEMNPATDTVIHGGAYGVDELVGCLAKAMGFNVSVYESNYRMHGNRAPLERDYDMARVCDRGVAVWNGVSGGTAYTVGELKRLGKPVKVIQV